MALSFYDIGLYFRDVALFWPGVLVSTVVSGLLAARFAPRFGLHRAHLWLLLFSVGLIVSATLTPSREALRHGAVGLGTCDMSRIGFPTLSEFINLDDTAFNVLLFLPLGFAVGLLPRRRDRLSLALVGVLMPVAIELTQLVVVALDRACQSSDVFNNVTGMLIGLAVGWVGHLYLDHAHRVA
jgi:hypothetical protein